MSVTMHIYSRFNWLYCSLEEDRPHVRESHTHEHARLVYQQ